MDIKQLFKEKEGLESEMKAMVNNFVKETGATRIDVIFDWVPVTKVGGSRKEFVLTDVEVRVII